MAILSQKAPGVCLLSIKSNLVKYSIGGVTGVRYGVIERACIELDPFTSREELTPPPQKKRKKKQQKKKL